MKKHEAEGDEHIHDSIIFDYEFVATAIEVHPVSMFVFFKFFKYFEIFFSKFSQKFQKKFFNLGLYYNYLYVFVLLLEVFLQLQDFWKHQFLKWLLC